MWASRRKAAPIRHVAWERHATGDRLKTAYSQIRLRNAAKQSTAIRVERSMEDGIHRTLFDDLTGIHDNDSVAEL
jgi:hypothetical protein